MGVTLWLDYSRYIGVELGPVIPCYRALDAVLEAVDCTEYPALASLIDVAESNDDAPPGYFAALQLEATDALEEVDDPYARSVLRLLAAPVANYSEDQPRDEHGRWGSPGVAMRLEPEVRKAMTSDELRRYKDVNRRIGETLGKERKAAVQEKLDLHDEVRARLARTDAADIRASEPAVAHPKAGQPLTKDQFWDRIRGAADAGRGLLKEVRAIRDEHGADDGEALVHGMERPERVRSMTVGGTKFSWSAEAQHVDSSMLSVLSRGVPEALSGATKAVVFSSQSNKDDPHWRLVYGKPDLVSSATGGDGTVCVYNQHVPTGLFAHECGHNVATERWGSVTPPATSEYGRAQPKEPPVSEYGALHPSEDFAEACRLYTEDSYSLKSRFPAKHAALDSMFTNR